MIVATAHVVDGRSTLAPSEPLDVQARVQIEQAVGALPRNTELTRRVLYVSPVAFQELHQALQLFELSSAAALPAPFVRDRFVAGFGS